MLGAWRADGDRWWEHCCSRVYCFSSPYDHLLHFSFQMVPVQALLTREERVSAGFLRYAKKLFQFSGTFDFDETWRWDPGPLSWRLSNQTIRTTGVPHNIRMLGVHKFSFKMKCKYHVYNLHNHCFSWVSWQKMRKISTVKYLGLDRRSCLNSDDTITKVPRRSDLFPCLILPAIDGRYRATRWRTQKTHRSVPSATAQLCIVIIK